MRGGALATYNVAVKAPPCAGSPVDERLQRLDRCVNGLRVSAAACVRAHHHWLSGHTLAAGLKRLITQRAVQSIRLDFAPMDTLDEPATRLVLSQPQCFSDCWQALRRRASGLMVSAAACVRAHHHWLSGHTLAAGLKRLITRLAVRPLRLDTSPWTL